MQAEVAVALSSGSLEDNIKEVSEDVAANADSETVVKKLQDKKPLVLDFSAYCDCV